MERTIGGMNKLRSYIYKLIEKERIKDSFDIFNDEFVDIPNRKNLAIFIDLINELYKKEDIAIFVTPFLENIEKYIIQPENVDIIDKMFDIITDQMDFSDIIMSGSFGLYIYDLIEKGIIDFDGNVVVVNGRMRKENPGIKILKQRYDIEPSDYIFLDDSYVYGGTKEKIEEFLNDNDSELIKTFVFYSHYEEDPNSVYSSFCYSIDVNEKIVPIHKQLDYLSKIDFKSCKNSLLKAIYNGEVEDPRSIAALGNKLTHT